MTNGAAVEEAFATWQPRVVVHLAARVGGITENIARQADFLIDNLRIDANLLNALRVNQPEHFLPMLSTCMYPDRLPDDRYPMVEDDIEEGAPPPTNAGYAAAKRSLLHGVRALHEQYNVPYTALIPANLYGPRDHFGEDKSHFLAACIGRVERARVDGTEAIEFFGTGKALRQYVFVEDVAALIAGLVVSGARNTCLNVAPSENRSIKLLAESVAMAAGYIGEVRFSGKGPDGQYRKDVSIERLRHLLPDWASQETSLADGLVKTIDWYRDHVATR